MKKVLHLVPHLSTGGCPQFAYDLIRKTLPYTNCICVEYSFVSPDFVVQRNRMIELLSDKFFSLGEDKTELFTIIKDFKPDVIHFQEFPEYFMGDDIAKVIYDKHREYVIVETSHDSGFNEKSKRFFADHLALISQWQIDKFKSFGIPISLLQSDIEKYPKVDREVGLRSLGLDPRKKHVLNVGLWTRRKNQGEVLEYAKSLSTSHPNIQFHFVGNQAGNFQDYWQPLMKELPDNVKIWGERNDVHNFYSCMDLFLFTSRGQNGDMETSPLVIRESTGHDMPVLIYNLPVYLGQYDSFENIQYLDFDDLDKNKELILKSLKEQTSNLFDVKIDTEENKIHIYYQRSSPLNVSISICDTDTKHAIYFFDSYFENYSSTWVVPIPKEARDNLLNKSNLFRGFDVNIYDNGRTRLLSTNKVFYNDNPEPQDLVLFPTNPWNLTWFNYNEMFIDGIYGNFVGVLTEITSVLDIGANDGLFVRYIKSEFPTTKVYAIECDQRAVKFMNKSFNNDPSVVVVNKALWKENVNDMRLVQAKDTSTLSSLVKEGTSNETETRVDAWSFKTLLSKHNIERIDLIKMDIEGGEYPLIESLSNHEILQIPYYIIEFHPTSEPKSLKLIQRFELLGYKVDVYSPSGEIYMYNEPLTHGYITAKYEDTFQNINQY